MFYYTSKSELLLWAPTLKDEPLYEVAFTLETPKHKLRDTMLTDGPENWIFKAKASIVFRALK